MIGFVGLVFLFKDLQGREATNSHTPVKPVGRYFNCREGVEGHQHHMEYIIKCSKSLPRAKELMTPWFYINAVAQLQATSTTAALDFTNPVLITDCKTTTCFAQSS